MQRIYFDVTDLVQHANNSSRVSGIQRVQARLIGSLARRVGSQRIRAAFWHPKRNEMVEFDPSKVFDETEFDSGRFLAQLGLWNAGRFPAQHEVRRYLARYNNRKIMRGLMKAWIYGVSLFAHSRLQSMGIDAKHRWAQEKKPRLQALNKIDTKDAYVFLGSNWSYPEILDFGKRHSDAGGVVVQMIYDLIPHLGPEYCSAELVDRFRNFLNRTPTYANRFACISDWTKKEFSEFLASKEIIGSVVTVPLAHEFDGFSRNQTTTKPDSNEIAALSGVDFVACIGTIEPRKNGANLLRAWDKLVQKRGKENVPRLVFAGKMGWKPNEFSAILKSCEYLHDHVIFLSSPSDQDLAFLYSKCHFTIYPSKYEGWGLPVGESAWFGKYVLSSTATSLPEVCGDLIDYFDPDDLQSIADKVEFALDHPEHVKKREEGIRSAKLRTWDEVADSLLAVIDAPR